MLKNVWNLKTKPEKKKCFYKWKWFINYYLNRTIRFDLWRPWTLYTIMFDRNGDFSHIVIFLKKINISSLSLFLLFYTKRKWQGHKTFFLFFCSGHLKSIEIEKKCYIGNKGLIYIYIYWSSNLVFVMSCHHFFTYENNKKNVFIYRVCVYVCVVFGVFFL